MSGLQGFLEQAVAAAMKSAAKPFSSVRPPKPLGTWTPSFGIDPRAGSFPDRTIPNPHPTLAQNIPSLQMSDRNLQSQMDMRSKMTAVPGNTSGWNVADSMELRRLNHQFRKSGKRGEITAARNEYGQWEYVFPNGKRIPTPTTKLSLA